jgi:hypothetical protein
VFDAQQTSGRAHAAWWRRSVLGLAVLSMGFWAASYSWVVGLTPPTRWISATASPWLIMEIAAVGFGASALISGILLARRASEGTRRAAILAAWLGGFALTATGLSLAIVA